jgi:hypothetical protein
MRWAGHAARVDEGKSAHMILVGKPESKRPLGRPRLRWVHHIKVDLQEVGWGQVAGSCRNLNATYSVVTFFVSLLEVVVVTNMLR